MNKERKAEGWTVIQLYNPETYHDQQAIVLSEAGRKKLIEALSTGKNCVVDAINSDGEGYYLGIFIRKDENEISNEFRDPYSHEWLDTSKPDPRNLVLELAHKNKIKWDTEGGIHEV